MIYWSVVIQAWTMKQSSILLYLKEWGAPIITFQNCWERGKNLVCKSKTAYVEQESTRVNHSFLFHKGECLACLSHVKVAFNESLISFTFSESIAHEYSSKYSICLVSNKDILRTKSMFNLVHFYPALIRQLTYFQIWNYSKIFS